MVKKIWLVCAAVAGLLVLAVGAGTAFLYCDARQARPGWPEYVALGSSYASGPFISRRAPHSPLLCAQSNDNYAHQTARALGLSLVDMSCAGATTDHVLNGGQYFQGPQLAAVDYRTRLVTLTIGGNDTFYLSNLVAESCDTRTGLLLKLFGSCKVKPVSAVTHGLSLAARNMGAIVEAIHNRAPEAQVIFVNYQTVMPTSGTCAQLGLTAAQADKMRLVAQALAATTLDVAEHHQASVLDVAALSATHNACSAVPWVAGAHPTTPHTAALHPNLQGMTAVANSLEQRWRTMRVGRH